jgi:hypothetical protein
VGEPPGRWPTEDAVREGRFTAAAPAHRTRLTALGSRIEAALVHGLAVRHDQRTATPTALVAELNGAGPPRRRYSDGEVQEIVKRATELEANTAGGAMTIGGVEALAAEVGVAPEVVRQAAASLRTARATPPAVAEPARWSRVIGGPTSILIERVVEGELPDSEYSAVVDEMRRVLKNVGQVSQLGRSFSWVATAGSTNRQLEVVVSVRGGRTRITLQENLAPLIGGIFGGIGGGMGGGGMGPIIGIGVGAFHLAGAAFAAIIPLWLVTTYFTARTAFVRTSRRRLRQLESLADRLAGLVGELV